jgi:hypothetical protein
MKKREQIERILGGKITPFSDEPLPGLTSTEGSEIVYVGDRPGVDIDRQLSELSRKVNPPKIDFGSIGATMHALRVPDGRLFHAFRYRGDLSGWALQIEQGARELKVTLGRIVSGPALQLSTGERYEIVLCEHLRM